MISFLSLAAAASVYISGDLHMLRGVPDVIVVNVRNNTNWEHEANDAITKWVNAWPQAHLADWYGHSNDSMFYADHTHPLPQYCPVYARVIATAVRRSIPKT